MARPLRIEFENAVYHATSRGNARQAIVRDDVDRDKWMELPRRSAEEHRWRVLAFALMTNHYHLFLQTPEANLSKGMQHLNSSFAGYVHARHKTCGHLFQGRFKAIVVESEGHWLELSRYVHLNPVRAGLVLKPEQWRWSSYPGYHLKRRELKWIDYSPVLNDLGGVNAAARRRYRGFVAEGLTEPLDSPLARAMYGLALGSEAFVERIRRMVEDRDDDAEVPQLSALRARPRLDAVVAATRKHLGGDAATWAQGRRCNGMDRAVAAYLGRLLCDASNREIARQLGYRNPSSVSAACRRVVSAMGSRRFAKQLDRLRDALSP